MESPVDAYWMNSHCVYSPTGSVDSGVGLAPEDIGNCDDIHSLFQNEFCPESPASCKIPSQIDNYNGYDSSDIFPPNQLTPDELDALSESNSLSPASVDHRFSIVQDVEELIPLPLAYTHRREICVGSSDNTQKRRRRQKERDLDLHKSHPHVHPCLVPKSGTAKPRQSRKRRKSQSNNSMTIGQGKNMSERNCYVGARVKKTAKERLEELRRDRDNKRQSTGQQVEVPEQSLDSSQTLSTELAGPSPKRRCPIIDDERVIMPNRMYAASVISQQQAPQSYNHSVQRILQPIPQRCTPDELEICIEEFLRMYNALPLQEYAQRHARVCYVEGRENSPLRYLLHKLHEKKDSYCPDDMRKIAEFLCKSFGKFINAKNFDGETLIYEAALHGNEGVAIALMNFAANPWIQENKGGQSALHAAIRSKRPRVINAILEYPKDEAKRWPSGINCPANDGNTPLHVATALTGVNADVKKEIVLKLLQYGADTTKKNHMSQMPHSFLVNDPKLKELQSEMKRLSQRKKSVPTPVLSMGPGHQQPRYHGMYATPYPQEQSMQSIHPNPNYQQSYGCASMQYNGARFPSITTQNDMPRFESHPCTTAPSGYYNHHNAHIPAFTTGGNDIDEFLSSIQ